MKINKTDFIIIVGDVNAKVGAENEGREQNMGRRGLGEVNETADLQHFAPLKIQGPQHSLTKTVTRLHGYLQIICDRESNRSYNCKSLVQKISRRCEK
jgi:hypothetical protein